jgi:hypothetical protein
MYYREIPCEIGGRAFMVLRQTLTALGGEPDIVNGLTYHVRISDQEGDSCDCLGWLKWGKCKHVEHMRKVCEEFPGKTVAAPTEAG